MRFVVKNLSNKPAILEKKSTLKTLAKVINNANSSDIVANGYQGKYRDADDRPQSSVGDKLAIYYLGKCAYCERHCKAEIEHYRPKAKVTEDGTHPGYYWLCYEWSNLLPSCHECNGSGGKLNKFPVKGVRVTAPPLLTSGLPDPAQFSAQNSPLIDEQPYLLHPEIDNPSEFMGVKPDPRGKGLKLYGTDGLNERGEQTIEICNLNRESLKINRLGKLKDFIKEINFTFKLLIDEVIAPTDLEEYLIGSFRQMDNDASDNNTEHTMMLRFVMTTDSAFAYLVLPWLELSQRAIVIAAFTEYRTSNPF